MGYQLVKKLLFWEKLGKRIQHYYQSYANSGKKLAGKKYTLANIPR